MERQEPRELLLVRGAGVHQPAEVRAAAPLGGGTCATPPPLFAGHGGG